MKMPTVQQYVSAQIELCGFSQVEISRLCGFKQSQMISMIKNGKVKVPLDKIRVLASALRVDPVHFFNLVIGEYHAELLDVLNELRPLSDLTSAELVLIKSLRDVNQEDLSLAVADRRKAFLAYEEAQTKTARIAFSDVKTSDKPQSGSPDW
ncbi:MAG: helix-turn-helix transcriptional regulator [Nevskia sp.]|nr:helix-turn-helix transcriptional regulator [Nevskia sp.]